MSCPACAAVAAATLHPHPSPAEQAERAAVATLVMLAVCPDEGLCPAHLVLVIRASENVEAQRG